MLPQGPRCVAQQGQQMKRALRERKCWHSWESFRNGPEGKRWKGQVCDRSAQSTQVRSSRTRAPHARIPEAFLSLLLTFKDSGAGRPLLSMGWPAAKSVARSPWD